jgi:hypothetical protein
MEALWAGGAWSCELEPCAGQLTFAWLLLRKVPAFNASLLSGTAGALAVDFAVRRGRGTPGSAHVLWIAAPLNIASESRSQEIAQR